TSLGAACIDVPDAVLLFCLKSLFVLKDHSVSIIINGRAGSEPCLSPSIHGKCIYIVTVHIVLDKRTVVYHLIKSIPGSLVYLRRVHVGPFGKKSLRPVDLQERKRIVPDDLSCLPAAVYVIGEGRNRSGKFFFRADRREWSEIGRA